MPWYGWVAAAVGVGALAALILALSAFANFISGLMGGGN